MIKNSDVTTHGFDFLIDIPLKKSQKTIIIYNNDERIPNKLFFERKSFLSEQNEIILITPDWKCYRDIYEFDTKTVMKQNL